MSTPKRYEPDLLAAINEAMGGGNPEEVADAFFAAGWRPLRDGDDEIDLESASREELQREVLRHRGTIARLDDLLRQRPSARVVSTVAELGELPIGTVVLSANGVAYSIERGVSYVFGMDRTGYLSDLQLPATVLHEGDAS